VLGQVWACTLGPVECIKVAWVVIDGEMSGENRQRRQTTGHTVGAGQDGVLKLMHSLQVGIKNQFVCSAELIRSW
jgi:hypothetical protein